ncbi:MAG: DUF819 family protein [Archangiaceae bacterium]|nr:DUF819 family protein [Archangiaceae bacterium]
MIQAVACFVVPALAMWAAERVKLFKILGPVVLCYAAGIIAANIPGVHVDQKVAMSLNEGSVALAIPLLLFSTELKKWLSLGWKLLLSFALACVSAVVAAGGVAWLFRHQTDEWWKVAGMLVGVYVGGTANMSAVGLALETKTETFVLLSAADVVAGGAWLLVLLTVAQRVLGRVLKPFTLEAHHELVEHPGESLSVWTKKHIPSMVTGFGLAMAMVLVSVGLSLGMKGKMDMMVVLLTLTALGILASLLPQVRALKGPYELGEYILLVFCVAVGSLADVRQVAGGSAVLFAFVVAVMMTAIVLHMFLCWVFRIDVDTALISSTATIYGPAFIGPVAASLKNRALVGPGLTMGLAGIALGTWLGIATAQVLRALAP